MATLTAALVTSIRTCGYTDAYWAKRLKVTSNTIRLARVGETYKYVPTPPDLVPREGGGRKASKEARTARERRASW